MQQTLQSHTHLGQPGGGVVRFSFLDIWQIPSWPPPFGCCSGMGSKESSCSGLLRPRRCCVPQRSPGGQALRSTSAQGPRQWPVWVPVVDGGGPGPQGLCCRRGTQGCSGSSGEQSYLPSVASKHLCPSPRLTFQASNRELTVPVAEWLKIQLWAVWETCCEGMFHAAPTLPLRTQCFWGPKRLGNVGRGVRQV